MGKLIELCQDMATLWSNYMPMYLRGAGNTLLLALVATAIGCVIGLVCGILNTIPYSKTDSVIKRFVLKLVRIVVRVYVEVFRGTPMVLQAVFIFYGLPYFTDNAMRFSSVWAAAILVRIVVRVYVEVFRGTPMVLQAVFIFYGLPYFTDNAMRFSSVWAAAILIVSVNTGAYMAESVRGGIISIEFPLTRARPRAPRPSA